MADGIKFKTTGLAELRAKMATVKQEVNYRGGRAALRKATAVLKAQAQQNAKRIDDPRTAEQIWANLDLRWNGREFKANGQLAFRLGVLGGARSYANTRENRRGRRAGQSYATGGSKANPGGDTWYWRFVEFGKEGVAAQPFLRPVGEQAGQQAINVFQVEFNRALDRAILKASK